jgi:alkylation response protein AidB-like acyl-CoA dehydrogenase
METQVDFELTGEQGMLKTLVERFVSDCYGGSGATSARATAAGYKPENWAKLAEMGLLALPFSEAYGGMGGDKIDMITAMEAFGRGLVAEPVLSEIMVAGRLLAGAGTEAQIAEWLPGIVSGTTHIALAYAEQATRFGLTKCETIFADGRLHGRKTCVPGGADLLIVTARDGDGVRLALAAGQAAGMTRRDYWLADGSVASEIDFDGVPAEAMPGGLPCLVEAARYGRMAASAEMLGLATLLFETTLDYVRQRRQFGASIGSFQAVQHRLADIYATLELARSHLYRCALAEPGQQDAAIAAAKSYISTMALRLGEECIQFHGGMGVSDELLIGHAHKRVLVLGRFFGDAEHELRAYNRAMAHARVGL